MPGQLPQILSPQSIRPTTEPQQVKQKIKRSVLLMLCILRFLVRTLKIHVWEILWILQNLVYISDLIPIWFPVSEPGYRCFTCSFELHWFLFIVYCFHIGYHLESFCSLWYDHSTNLPWNCPIGVIPVCITTLQQSFWHIRYVLNFGIRPSRFIITEILAVNFAVSFLNGNATPCCR